MDAFISIISSFPTAIFTTINLVLIGLWLLMAFGLFDIEFLDFDLDTDIDVELDAEASGMSGIATFLASLGLTGVPLTIVLTILCFTAWLISYFCVKYGLFWNNSDAIRYLIGGGILIGSFVVAIPITAQLIIPLKKFFAALDAGPTALSLLGAQCRVRSSKVTPSFGEAECDNEGATLLLKIRSDEKYALKKGDLIRIIEVDKERSIYQVVPEDEFNQHQD